VGVVQGKMREPQRKEQFGGERTPKKNKKNKVLPREIVQGKQRQERGEQYSIK